MASTSGRSSDSTSTETESDDADLQEDLRSENCSQDQSASSPDGTRMQTMERFTIGTSKRGVNKTRIGLDRIGSDRTDKTRTGCDPTDKTWIGSEKVGSP